VIEFARTLSVDRATLYRMGAVAYALKAGVAPGAAYFGFHSRASFWASAICAGVNCAATISRAFIAFLFLLPAAKLNHICAAA
jgi:hypothetical protein